MFGEVIGFVLKLLKYVIGLILLIAIISALSVITVEFTRAVLGFIGLILPFEGSIFRDFFLMINMWSPIDFGIIFNNIMFMLGTFSSVFILNYFMNMFNKSFSD